MHFALAMFTSPPLQPRAIPSQETPAASPSSRFPLPEATLLRFIAAVRYENLDNAYHNWTHSVDTMQAAYALALANGTFARLTPLQGFGYLVSALCADLGHPGVTSQFLIATRSDEAILYNDRHVLENTHACKTFQLLNNRQIVPMEELSNADYATLRAVVLDNIMATDMSSHSRFADALHDLAAKNHAAASTQSAAADCNNSDSSVSPTRSEVQREMQYFIKAADMCNVCRPFDIAKKWAVRVSMEFFVQGNRERAVGLPVTPICDVQRQSVVNLQKRFMDLVAGPFYSCLGEAYPAVHSLIAGVITTRNAWDWYDGDARLFKEVECDLCLLSRRASLGTSQPGSPDTWSECSGKGNVKDALCGGEVAIALQSCLSV